MAFAQAQNSKSTVTGNIIDSDKKALDGAVIYCLRAKDSSLVKSAFSGVDGVFELFDLPFGDYFLTVTNVGFAPYKSPIIALNASNTMLKMPPITLQKQDNNLAAVTVTAKLPLIVRKIDRTIVNIEAMTTAAGTSAWEALEKVPGVVTEAGGVIRLKGKNGVVVLIDDKPTYLSGEQLEAFLRTLPTSTLKQIEVLPNPPAKYDAAGNAGVIIIRTKRNRLEGFYGSIATSYTQGRYARNNNSLNVNFGRKRLNLFANYNFTAHNSFQDLNIARYYKKADGSDLSNFIQNSYIKKGFQSHSLKIGMDYSVSDKTTLGLVATGLLNPSFDHTANTAFTNANNARTGSIIADNYTKNTFENGSINLNFRHNFDSTATKTLTIDADYVKYATGAAQKFKNWIYNADGSLNYRDSLRGNLPTVLDIYAFKADYTQPLKGNMTLETGAKLSYTTSDNTAEYFNYQNGKELINNDLTNRFLYKEWIAAAYINATKSLKRWDFQAGLRLETTLMNGFQYGNAVKPTSDFKRDYTNLFPTAFVSYKLDSAGQQVLSLTYGRRIERPFFQDLNPFLSPLDKFTFYTGNPSLTPTFSNNYSLNYTINNINISASYGTTQDGIYETLEIINQIYYSRPKNVGFAESATLGLETSIPVGKWLTMTLSTEGGYNAYRGQLYTETLNSSGFYGYASMNNSFNLGKGWTAELSGDYITNVVYSQLILGPRGGLNAGFQKKLFQNKANLRVTFSDFLYTKQFDGVINNLAATKADWNSRLDTRSVNLTFSYKFGKAATTTPKQHNTNGSEAERNRVKT